MISAFVLMLAGLMALMGPLICKIQPAEPASPCFWILIEEFTSEFEPIRLKVGFIDVIVGTYLVFLLLS